MLLLVTLLQWSHTNEHILAACCFILSSSWKIVDRFEDGMSIFSGCWDLDIQEKLGLWIGCWSSGSFEEICVPWEIRFRGNKRPLLRCLLVLYLDFRACSLQDVCIKVISNIVAKKCIFWKEQHGIESSGKADLPNVFMRDFHWVVTITAHEKKALNHKIQENAFVISYEQQYNSHD